MYKNKSPDYKKLYEIVTKLYNKTEHFNHGPFDETFFTLRVYECSKELIKRLNKSIKKEELLVASILHDVGKIKMDSKKLCNKHKVLDTAHDEWMKHGELGISIAEDILKKENYSKEFIKTVSYLIKNHPKRGNEMKNKTLELQILQDADLLADCGFAGFIRPFLYCGKFKSSSVIGSIKYLKNQKDRVENEDSLNLEISKQIAKEKMKVQKHLVSEISKDIESDLL